MKPLAEDTASRKKMQVRPNPFIFRWGVNDAGYQWGKGLSDGKPRLVPRRVPGMGVSIKEPPPTIFKDFAETETTPTGIKAFADRYGNLFDSYSLNRDSAAGGGGGASLHRWRSEIEQMRSLVDLWTHIRMSRITELSKVVRWVKTKDRHKAVSYVLETPTRKRDVTLAHSLWGLGRFTEGDVLLPARCALQREINLRLEEYPTVPQLAWTPDTMETTGGYYQRIVFTSPNLLAAMWVRFAQAVTRELDLATCKVCGVYFQIGPGGRRLDSQYCGNRCRQANWDRTTALRKSSRKKGF